MDVYNVELTGAEVFLLFSITNQTIKEMEAQGRDVNYPKKYKTLLAIKSKLKERLEVWRENDGK